MHVTSGVFGGVAGEREAPCRCLGVTVDDAGIDAAALAVRPPGWCSRTWRSAVSFGPAVLAMGAPADAAAAPGNH